eukprot:COSAG01_NODE_5417_length_4275_cov_18.204262_5_plen_217_part_00
MVSRSDVKTIVAMRGTGQGGESEYLVQWLTTAEHDLDWVEESWLLKSDRCRGLVAEYQEQRVPKLKGHCASIIQATFRGMIHRKLQMFHAAAANKLQRVYRGHLARKMVSLWGKARQSVADMKLRRIEEAKKAQLVAGMAADGGNAEAEAQALRAEQRASLRRQAQALIEQAQAGQVCECASLVSLALSLPLDLSGQSRAAGTLLGLTPARAVLCW